MRAATERGESETLHTADGVCLHVRSWGESGDPLVLLLHGGGANLHWWTPIAPALARGHRVVALDFRGHGDSEHPEERATGAFHRDVGTLTAHLGDRPRVLVGHSLGARIALDLSASCGEVRGVVAIEVSAGASRANGRRMRLALATRRTYASREEAVSRYQFLPAAPGASEELRRHIAGHSIRETPDGRFAFKFDPHWFRIPAREPADPASIRSPVLVIRGCESSLLTSEGARALVRALPDGRLLEMEDAGHNVHLERPADVAAAIREHLAHCFAPS